MALMSVEEWRKQKAQQGTASSSAPSASSSVTVSSEKTSGGTSRLMSVAEWRAERATKSAQGWADAANALLKDTQKYFNSWRSKDDEEYNSIKERSSTLLAQADSWRKQYAGNDEALSYIDEVVSALSKARQNSRDYFDYYGQWDSADSYNKWMQYSTPEKRQAQYEKNQARLEELRKQQRESRRTIQPGTSAYLTGESTTTASPYGAAQQNQQASSDIDKEIAQIEKEMRLYEYGEVDETGFYYGYKTADDYGKYLQDSKFLDASKNRTFQNGDRAALSAYDAEQSQGSMALSTGGYIDDDGYIRDAYGNVVQDTFEAPVQDKLGMFLSASDEDINEAYTILNAVQGSYPTTWASILQEGDTKRWKYLNDEELSIYYGLLNTEGQEAAYRYLDAMEVELGRREMKQVYAYIDETSGLEQIMLNVASVPLNLIGGIAATADNVGRLVTGKDLNPYSRAQSLLSTGNYIRSNTAQEIDAATGNIEIPGLGFSFGDAYQAGMSMVDSLVGAKIGGKAYQAVMSMGAASSEMARLYSQGASTEQMILGSVAAGAAEWVFEKYSIENLINLKSPETLLQFAKNALIQGGIEMSEEAATELANIITNGIIMQSESDWAKLLVENDGDYGKALTEMAIRVGNAGLGGFLSGMGSGSIQQGMQYGAQQQENKKIGSYISGANSTDDLMALALDMASGTSGRTQKNLNSQSQRIMDDNFLTKGGKNQAIGRLYNTVNSVVTEQNISEISTALQTKGFSKKDAVAIAGAVAVQASGLELTDKQQKVLEKFGSNEDVQAVLGDVLGNEESGINQRAKSIAQFEFGTMRNHITAQIEQSAAVQENEQQADNVDAQNEKGAESRYEVSVEGKTILKSTGEIVNVQEVADTSNGQMVLRLDNGSTVNAEDVSFSSAGEALVYETVAQMGASVKAANIIVNRFKSAEGLSAVYAHGIAAAFRYGKLGIPMRELVNSDIGEKVDAGVMEFVYRQGKKAAGKQVAKEQATVLKNRTAAEAATAGKVSTRSYQATLEDGITEESLNESQKVSYHLAGQIAEAAKVNIRVYAGKTGEHGYYNYKTDEIYLNLNATNKSRKSMMAFTLGHELVHRAKNGSPAKYKQFANFLMEQYSKQGSDIEDMIGEELAAAKRFHIEMSYDEAFEEVVCDACQRMLLDTDAGQKLAEFGAQSKQNKSFLDDLKRWITEFMDKLRSIFAGVEPDSLAAQEFAQFDAGVKQILADMYVDMTIDAGNNLSAVHAVLQENAEAISSDEIITDGAVVTDGSEVKYSIKSMKADIAEGQMFEDLKTFCGWAQKQVDDLKKNLQDLVEYMTPYRDILDMNETYGREGRRFSPYKPNSDPLYKISMDFSTLCSKRLLTQYVIENLQLRENRPMSAEEQMAIRHMLNEYRKVEKGLQVACAMCYVEAARLKSPKQIQKWMDDPETAMRNYFADKNPDFAAYIKEKQSDFKESRGYARNATKKDMSAKDVRELNKIRPRLRSQYKVSAEESKIIERAKALPSSTYLTAANLANLSETEPTIYTAYTAFVRTATRSKSLETDEPYYYGDSRRDNGNGIVVTDDFIESVNRENGMRFSSWSDWRIQHMLDYITAVIDNSVRGAAMHGYTKFGEEVRVLGKTGMMFNMSGVAGTQTGLNEDGSLSFSPTESIDVNEAIQLREEFPEHAGLQCIGVGDDHIVALLRSDIIDYVIPYHISGLNAALRRMANIQGWADYTTTQHAAIDKSIKLENAVDKEHWHEEPVYSEFFVGYDTGMTGIEAMRASADNYVRMCRERGLKPKFEQFLKEDNYWKLLIDRKMINQKTGKLIRQKAVTPTFDFATIKEVVDRHVQNYDSNLEARALNHIVENWDSIPKHIKDLKKQGNTKTKKAVDTLANQTLAAQPADGQKVYSLPKGEPAPTFYSHMARVVDGVKQEKLGAASVVPMLRGKGVKVEEIKWSGIETFLEGKKSVTKAELQEFIAGSMLQIEEDILTDQEIPYSREHLDLIAKYGSERDTIAENLKSEWKRIVGTDIPITYFGAGLESAVVNNLLEANATKKGNTEAGYQYKAKRAALQRVIEDGDHYFGFDNARQALREAVRDPKNFMKSYEMTSFEESVFKDFIKAKEAYTKVEGISMQDQKALKAIAESADRFSSRILKVKSEHRAEAAKYLTKYRSYTIKGGTNYRELLFRMPGATYSNTAMDVHWERSGVLAHARIQDLNTFLGKMLFIEEIQSDWHNEGHKSGYTSEADLARISELEDQVAQILTEKDKINQEYDAFLTRYWEENLSDEEYRQYLSVRQERLTELSYKQRDLERELRQLELSATVPDAPFKDTYHEYVLKRLIRMAAEQDYDSIGWTTAQIQSDRWSDEFAEGYRIEYDQDIPKFLNKYGKKWGTRVGKTTLDNGTEVWSMAITDEMKDSVLYEGQVMYSLPKDGSSYKEPAYQEWDVQAALYDAMDHADKGDDNMILVGEIPRYITDLIGIEGDFYIYRNHAYENMVSREQAIKDGRPVTRKGEKIHFHDLGVDVMTEAIMSLENPTMTIATKTAEGNPAVIMLLPVPGKNKAPLYAILSFYSNRPINGDLSRRPHVVLTIAEREFFGSKGRGGYAEIVGTAVKDGRVIDFNKKMRDDLSVIANPAGVGNITDSSLAVNLARFRKEIKSFREKNHIDYKLPVGEDTSPRALLANAFESVITNPIEKNKLEEYKGKIDLLNTEERKLSELREQIKELSFAKGPKDTKKIRDLQFEAIQTSNRISNYDKILLRMEASKPLQNVLTREKEMVRKREEQKRKEALAAYREKAAKTQRELLKRYEDSRKKAMESREKTAMRHKIQNVVGELNQLLLHGDKKRHVPENLKKAVADALALVNMDTVGAEERAAKYAALIAKETDPDKIDAYTVTMENILRQGEKMGQRLKELRDAYEEIQESDDPDIANAYDPVIAGCLKELSQSIGNTSLRNMSIEQLSDVYDMYRMVLTRVRDANKTLLENIKENISNLASRVIGEVRMTGGDHKYRASVLDPVRKFLWNNLKPVYAMEHMGSSTLTKVFDNVRAGEDTWAKDVTEAREYYLDKSRKYGYDSWDFKKKYRFDTEDGTVFDLTLEQILSLYAYSKREQVHDHLRLGGFVFDSNIETYTEKGSKLLKYKVNTADAHQITTEILADIIGTLTSEQMGFVDEMQAYLSTVMGAKGNEVTMKMYGVKLFKEKHYFPLKSAKQFMFEQNEVSGEVRIKNSGFTNKVVAKANNPVILSNFMDVWAGHVNDMSMYHAFVLPLEDFNRVFNYNSPKREGQPPVSVKGTIQNAYSPAAVNYVKNLITDLNGGARSDSTTGVINKLTGLFKKGAVFASASVVIQQPSAIARAAALVDTKYFIGPKVDAKRHSLLWDEVKQYAPVAIIKEMGYFDTNMGKSTQDFILGKEYSGFSEKMKALVTDSNYRDEVLSKAPALADEIAWCSIWEAVKRETHAKHPGVDVKSEAFLKKAGERFTEVIVKTQVYDSVLARSANMRSKDTGMKMATAFMAEPTTSINMIADALLKGKRGGKDGRKFCRRTIGSVVASVILNSFLVAWVQAARDDDEDESYMEKYVGSFTAEVLDGMNPLTYIPFIKDIVSIVQGYDVERSDMSVISDIVNAFRKLSSDKVSGWKKVEEFVGSICQIFGLPVKNIMRDARSVWQAFNTIVNGERTTARGIGYAVKGAITGKSVSNPDQLYESKLAGDAEHTARVEARYEDEDSADAAVRQAIKDRFMDGEIDTMTALRYMVLHAGMDASEAHWTMDAWEYRKAMGTDEGYSKYNDFFEAVKTGKNLKAVIKEYTDNGVKEDTLASMITKEFKPEYIEMSVSERANIKGYLINALEQCGVDREDAEERLADWDFEAKYGFSYSNRKEAYLEGEVSASELRKVLIEVGGYDEDDADAQIEAYDWEAQGYEGATVAAVRNYNEHCAGYNVPRGVYLHIRSFSNNTENDVDEVTGKTIYYSAMKKVMEEINAQNLTPEQKTAVARSLGWSEKNIRKYKLW